MGTVPPPHRLNKPFRWTLREAAKGVQLAELAIDSWKQRRWIDVRSWLSFPSPCT